MSESLLRRTVIGVATGAALFGLIPLLRLVAAGESLAGAFQPLLWFAFLGAVIGGLAGPLVGQAWARLRSRG
jgi:hypothetical protein